MTDHFTAEDIAEAARRGWAAIIECRGCGERGLMRSTDEPREISFWECEVCGNERIHDTVLATSDPRGDITVNR